MTPTAGAGGREGAYYLVAPSLHEGVMKTQREGRRGWASRREKEGSFCESKYAKMASETPHFDFKNRISGYFCKIILSLKLIFANFITQSFKLKNCASFAHQLVVAKGGGNYFPKNSLYSSAWIYFLRSLLCFSEKKKTRFRPSLRSFISL